MKHVYIFIITICFIAASLLSVVANLLHPYQLRAKELDRSKQLLISAKLLSYDGYFLRRIGKEEFIPASKKKASERAILALYQKRVSPMVVDDEGNSQTFKDANINFSDYLKNHEKKGFSKLSEKLIYFVYASEKRDTLPEIYVIPINGFGLWDAIYGYLAIDQDADTVIGTTWYEQKETAGLGANISLPSWQKQFLGKEIFLKNADGNTNFKSAPLGITVVKGDVESALGNKPKADSAVDGISGATLTSQGVTNAYHSCLSPYRPFLVKAHEAFLKEAK